MTKTDPVALDALSCLVFAGGGVSGNDALHFADEFVDVGDSVIRGGALRSRRQREVAAGAEMDALLVEEAQKPRVLADQRGQVLICLYHDF